METIYQELFEYNYQMNQKLIQAFVEHSDKVSEKSVKWFNHILNAHHLWNNRIDKQREDYGVWQIHSLGYLADINLTNYNWTKEILKNTDLNKTINYVNSQGKAYTNIVKDILLHVVNHSTYHRGQIAADFRDTGLEPINTDYIAFKR